MTLGWKFACAVLLALLGVLSQRGPASAQERQQVTGTTVSMVPTEGFVPATGFAGFANERLQASVLVVELPVSAHPQIAEMFSDLETAKRQFAKQRISVVAREEIQTAAGQVPLIISAQAHGGVTFDKWMGLFKGARTVMITVQAPKDVALDAVCSISGGRRRRALHPDDRLGQCSHVPGAQAVDRSDCPKHRVQDVDIGAEIVPLQQLRGLDLPVGPTAARG